MKPTDLKYDPQLQNEVLFECSVPMPGVAQAYMLDGKLQSKDPLPQDLTVTEGKDGLGMDCVLAAGAAMQAPLQLISVRKEAVDAPLAFTNLWTVEAGAHAQVIVCDHTLEDKPYHTLRNTCIDLKPNARLDILFMQSEYNASHYRLQVEAHLAENAQLNCHLISLHGGDIRNSLNISLDKEGAGCFVNGIFLADGKQQISSHIDLLHAAPGCYSNQLLKGVLDGQARGRFEGLIKVNPGAQKTEAYQANHNLLLTKEARMVTQPQLEIYADDVKCSHGASIGRMDELALFYMRQRGISLHEAKLLQQMAFIHDVLDNIPWEAIRNRLDTMVERRLRGDFYNCSKCHCRCC